MTNKSGAILKAAVTNGERPVNIYQKSDAIDCYVLCSEASFEVIQSSWEDQDTTIFIPAFTAVAVAAALFRSGLTIKKDDQLIMLQINNTVAPPLFTNDDGISGRVVTSTYHDAKGRVSELFNSTIDEELEKEEPLYTHTDTPQSSEYSSVLSAFTKATRSDK